MQCPECKCHSKNSEVCEYCDFVIYLPEKKVKIKEENVKDLVKELDRVFSIFIRTRYMDNNGDSVCFTCNNTFAWRQMHCGHLVLREFKGARYDEVNCQCQCPKCNGPLRGNIEVFKKNLQSTYGIGVLQRLEALSTNETVKLDREYYKKKIVYYKKKIEQVK
jgi:hypothetical protein